MNIPMIKKYYPFTRAFGLSRLFSVILLSVALVCFANTSADANSRKRAAIAAGVAGVIIGIGIANANKKKKEQATTSKKPAKKQRSTAKRKAAPKKKSVAKRKPSKKVAKRSSSKKKKVASVRRTPIVPGNRNTVTSVQAKLNELGFDAGPVDGQAGRKTKEAVKRYQQSIAVKTTGFLTSNDVADLLATPAEPKVITASVNPSDDTTAFDPAPQVSDEPENVNVQNALAALGFEPGPPNGKLEGKTIVAIMEFQKTLGSSETGKLTQGQKTQLLSAALVARAQGAENSGIQTTAADRNLPQYSDAPAISDELADLEEELSDVPDPVIDYTVSELDELETLD